MAAVGRTIFAVASGRGRSGIAVVRMSGPSTSDVLIRVAGGVPPARKATLRRLVDPKDGTVIDEGLVLWFPGPGSYTGEDVAEFHVHGGPAVIAAMLEVLGGIDGVEPAEAGEFTRRAFHNGKLDLTAVEGLGDLIAAETEGQRRQALRQMSGALAAVYDGWRGRLVRELAYFEAQIDFPDEGDVPGDVIDGAVERLSGLVEEIREHLDDDRRGERLRDGVRVAIAGRPNVGKSSLLNLLARRDVAIVSERPGTTRDVIEVHLDLGGVPVIVADTAGLRESDDAIEAEGMARARHRIGDADIVMWVTSPDAPGGPGEAERLDSEPLLVMNKVDLVEGRQCGGDSEHRVSARTGEGIDGLIRDLGARVAVLAGVSADAGVTRARHRHALSSCLGSLERAVGGDRDFPELVAEDLRAAAMALGRLTGRVDVEDLLDVIFADFCIGK